MYAFLQYRVQEFMTRDPAIVAPTDTLATLGGLLDRHGVNGAPVVGGDGALRGPATKYDLLRAFRFTTDRLVPSCADIMRAPVSATMILEPTTVASDSPLTRVLELLVAARHKSSPVLADGHPSGMIARNHVGSGGGGS